ncbi:MAG: hypothetical protein PHR75_04045 [Sulfurovum sp.]|nr:hypothetical protein [Sulfurovum sp.]MDD3602555.1 hypothetical protein [Sulfurovum sp.]
MRLQTSKLNFVVNFFLGVAWALVLIGAVTSFLSFYQLSIVYALVSAVAAALPGLFIVLVLEHIITVQQQHEELKKQTELLEKLLIQKEQDR